MDIEKFLDTLPKEPIFDLVITSPPYNIGKEYERQMPLEQYVEWQKRIIKNDVRLPSKYPGKRSYRGSNKGKLSGNPRGKNPEDVWNVPNVKGNHIEKTTHPCQFPVGLIERLILALSNEGDLVFDPFAGVASSGVAALLHNRHFWGCDIKPEYLSIGQDRLNKTLSGEIKYRPYEAICNSITGSCLYFPWYSSGWVSCELIC